MATVGAERNSTVNPLPELESQVKQAFNSPHDTPPPKKKGKGKEKAETRGGEECGAHWGHIRSFPLEETAAPTPRHARSQIIIKSKTARARVPREDKSSTKPLIRTSAGLPARPNSEPEPRRWESGSQPDSQRARRLLIAPNNVMKWKSKATPGGAPERRESCIFAHQPIFPKNRKVTIASRFHSPYTPWPEIPSRRTVSSHTRPYTKSIFT